MRINRGPPRVSGAREQCKKYTKIDPYFISSITVFNTKNGLYHLKPPLVTGDNPALINLV